MSEETLNTKLAKLNLELAERVAILEKRLDDARVCKDESLCPLCTADERCVPHEMIVQLRGRKGNVQIRELETRLAASDEARTFLEKELIELRNKHHELHAGIPEMVARARLDASEILPELELRHRNHIEFIEKLARRLGIRPNTTIERIQSMVDDAIRKLLS